MSEYMDEKLLEAQREMKKEKYATPETGMFLNDKIVEFERRGFYEEKISAMIPKDFVVMPPNIAKTKYPSVNRPEIILTNLQLDKNVMFTWTEQALEPSQVQFMAETVREMTKNAFPANVFYEFKNEKWDELYCTWFDHKSHTIEGQLYNMAFFFSIEKRLLYMNMNCEIMDQNEWKPAFYQMARSIALRKDEEAV